MEKLPLLVGCEWLQEHLRDPDLRILECTVFLSSAEAGLQIDSGYEAWKEAHIPNSGFADLLNTLSDREAEFPFMLPFAGQFAKAMSQYGVGEGMRVVLYDRAGMVWAARVWWMLRMFGFENAAILNGGWQKWMQDGYPLSQEISEFPDAEFHAEFRSQYLATKQDVLSAFEDDSTLLINTLKAESFRAAHIPGSVNIPYVELLDPGSGTLLDFEALRDKFHNHREKVICYCGSGITACIDAFALNFLGREDVAVYDGSMSEWTADEALPVEKGVIQNLC